MIELLLGIILLPFAALAATVTIIFATGIVIGAYKTIFRNRGEKHGTKCKAEKSN